jgi:hypothetical protein
MSKSWWIFAIVGGAAIGGGWYLKQHREEPGRAPGATPAAVVADASKPKPLAYGEESGATPQALPPGQVDQWISDANGSDAGKRAAAISALAQAPRAQALPVLHHVLINGEPTVDRPLALRALRELALEQGDADGAVRGAIREAIYHGDGQDETLLADAQDALDVVEESEMR